MAAKDQRITVRLDGRDLEKVALLARQHGRSTAEEIRDILRGHLTEATRAAGGRPDVEDPRVQDASRAPA
ncbi:ribbon-helix-helix protein, CopG family [Baekduia sp.]|jgi:plasmid stability protein|uniref:ribbon-helix-helix protein, CopG family n=1 Tax=Baekduia sp. TaxID=2600305 RepID=UPI002E02E84C|nr:ribbon-helix-helix protein, CopG family [Baekduia sp.]